MARPAAAKSNGRSQPRGTQRPSQSQPSQSQRSRHTQAEDDDDGDEEDDVEMEAEGEAEEAISRRANALVRLALFNEVKRVPLKRDDISKKVLEGHSRQFKAVLTEAQRKLQASFGMELVELVSRAELNREDFGDADEAVTGVKKKKVTTSGSKTYILRSTLHSSLIEAAALTDEQILEEELVEVPENEDEGTPQAYGSIFSWSTSDQLGALGMLYVILSLILLSGRVLSDVDLKKHFRSLQMDPKASLLIAAHGAHKKWTVESYLHELQQKGHLIKAKVDLGTGTQAKSSQGKRGRLSRTEEEDAVYEWKWGPRAHAEVGEEAIGQFIGEFMVERTLKDQEAEDAADGENPRNRRRNNVNDEEKREKMLETVMKGISRAAGGALSEITAV